MNKKEKPSKAPALNKINKLIRYLKDQRSKIKDQRSMYQKEVILLRLIHFRFRCTPRANF